MVPPSDKNHDNSGIFLDAKSKSDWADQRIGELEAFLHEIVHERDHPLSVEENDDSSYTVTVESEPLPQEVALVLGDCIHNLRVALDLMYVELVHICGGSPDRSTNFPFRKDRSEVGGQLRADDIEATSGAVADVLLDTVQPYEGGQHDLYALNRLDIADKHHLVLPVMGVTELTDVTIRDVNDNVIRSARITVDAESGKLSLLRTNIDLQDVEPGEASSPLRIGAESGAEQGLRQIGGGNLPVNAEPS